MCRAAGLPARYVGAIMIRGDDASTDEVYHRWPEVYLPGYGVVLVAARACSGYRCACRVCIGKALITPLAAARGARR